MTLEEGYSRSVHLGKRPGSQKARLSFSLTQLFFNTVDDEYNTIFAKLTKKKLFEAMKKIIPNQILRVWG